MYSDIKLYFGGTILGFAACLGNIECVDYLLEHGADVTARDLGPASGMVVKDSMRTGNSVLHCCVLHEQVRGGG